MGPGGPLGPVGPAGPGGPGLPGGPTTVRVKWEVTEDLLSFLLPF